MGIYLKLGSPIRISPLDRAVARLYYCTEAIRHFQIGRFFIPKKVKIWLNAPSETLNGKLIFERDVPNFHDTTNILKTKFQRSFYSEELASSIVVFEGQWQLNELEVGGFFSCNNFFAWNRAYLDVEIDAYSSGEYGDLTDVFIKHNEVPEVAKSFISSINASSQNQQTTPRYIYFSRGAPEFGEVEDLIVLHLRDRHDMTGFLYAKLRKTEEPWVKAKLEPIDKTFYLSSLASIEAVESIFSDVVKETDLIEKTGNSITYIAKDTVTFRKFYEQFKESIFQPASKELPDADALKKSMERGLEGTRTRSLF